MNFVLILNYYHSKIPAKNTYIFTDKHDGRMQDGWILVKFLFCASMDQDGVKVHKQEKKKE